MDITALKSDFLVKAQVKIGDLALFVSRGLMDSFEHESDLESIITLEDFVATLQSAYLDWSDLKLEQEIHYMSSLYRLNDIGVSDLTGKLTNILVGGVGGSVDVNELRSYVLNMEININTRLVALEEAMTSGDYTIPTDVMNKINEAYNLRHDHTNKTVLDQITQGMLTIIGSIETHIGDSGIHVTLNDKSNWDGKVTQQQLTDGLSGKADTEHGHEIADVNGLEDRLVQISNSVSETPVFSIGTVSPGTSPIVTVDVTNPATPVLNFTLVKGDTGDPGDSAYQIWLNEGNVGTEQDFLNSLKSTSTAPGSSKYEVNDPLIDGFISGKVIHVVSSEADVLKVLEVAPSPIIMVPTVDISITQEVTTSKAVKFLGLGEFKTSITLDFGQGITSLKTTESMVFEGLTVSGTLNALCSANPNVVFNKCVLGKSTRRMNIDFNTGTNSQPKIRFDNCRYVNVEVINTEPGNTLTVELVNNGGNNTSLASLTVGTININNIGTLELITDGSCSYTTTGVGTVSGKSIKGIAPHIINDLPNADVSDENLTLMVVTPAGNLVKKQINFAIFGSLDQTEYTFTSSLQWTVTHNKGLYPDPIVVDTAGTKLYPSIHYVSPDKLVLTHSDPIAGKVYI